ncbi:hypothetical protein [Pseudarthrobacter sp.]
MISLVILIAGGLLTSTSAVYSSLSRICTGILALGVILLSVHLQLDAFG